MKKILDFAIEKIERSNRKTLAIEITPDAKLLIKAPWFVSDKQIENFILRNFKQIAGAVRDRQKIWQFVKKKFVDGEKFLFLGKFYPLKIVDKLEYPLDFYKGVFYLRRKDRHRAKQLFEMWYKQQALPLFYKRALIYSKLLGVEFRAIKLSNAKRRWGSCSSKGNINIVWRLIMAPLEIIDYVIVHELTHLIYMNHSKLFWRKVAQVYPNYKEAMEWLKKYGGLLEIY